jgi:hypothetical protein
VVEISKFQRCDLSVCFWGRVAGRSGQLRNPDLHGVASFPLPNAWVIEKLY